MVKKFRFKRVLIVVLIFTMLLTSCRFFEPVRYTGDYPELFSVAIGSALGMTGYEREGGRHVAAGVVPIEEDRFGRVLFRYSEEAIFREVDHDSGRVIGRRVVVYIVAQIADGDYVYFYPHYNFIIRGESGVRVFESYFEDIPRVSNEDLTALKEANSWNQEMSDDSAFDRVRIVRRKEDGPASRDDRMVYLRSDRYGRSVYAISTDSAHFVYFIQPDHSLDMEAGIIEIRDLFSYQTELRLFMEANGWNAPWVEP